MSASERVKMEAQLLASKRRIRLRCKLLEQGIGALSLDEKESALKLRNE